VYDAPFCYIADQERWLNFLSLVLGKIVSPGRSTSRRYYNENISLWSPSEVRTNKKEVRYTHALFGNSEIFRILNSCFISYNGIEVIVEIEST